jgi:zinc protease
VRSAVRGAGGYDGGALALAFERLGGTLGAAVSAEMFGFVTTVLSEHLGEAAALLALVLHQPSLGADDVVLERGLLAEDAAQIEDDMYRHPIQLAYSAAFGEHGYGLPLLGRPDTVRALEPEAVSEWHRTMLSAGRTTIVAVGDFEPGEAAATLAARFAALPAATAVDPPLTPPEPGEPAIRHRAVRRDKAQTALAMLFPGPDRRAADRHAAEVWAAVAGGLGGRLFEALRDRRSLAYTVAAYPWQRRTAGGLVTYIATSPDREEEARQAMLAELETFRNGGVSATDVLGAVNYLVGQDEVRRQGAAAQAEELLDAWLHGMGLAELEDPAAPYRAVTADAVREVARRYLCPDRRAEGVVRGAVAPAPSLPGGDRPGS